MKWVEYKDGHFKPSNKVLRTSILNIGAGKINPIDLKYFEKYFLVNLDTMYRNAKSSSDIEDMYRQDDCPSGKFLCDEDVNGFLSSYYYRFNLITMYRYLEHVPFDDVLYFIYQLSTALEVGGYLDVVVPDCKLLASMITNEKIDSKLFERNNILITTELLNQPEDPHASIWTVDRIQYFFTLEGRFKIINIEKYYTFDGREIYIRAIIQRIK